jgi:hypothetical protein
MTRGNDITLETKLDYKTLNLMPFVPTHNRKKDFELTTKWGNTELFIKAPESVNTYDLVTLMFITKAYLKHNWYAGYIGEGEEKREIAGLELDLEQVCRERQINNEKNNRNTILKSIARLSHIDLLFTTNKEKEIMTKYIYEIRYDKSYKKVKIYANKRFIEFIISKGILINLSDFVKLEKISKESKDTNQKERVNYAILLYAFLNGTKEYRGKNLWWREKYSEELLFNVTKLSNTKLEDKKKRQALKQAFELLHKTVNLPKYTFNKNEKMWVRADLIEKRQKVN